MLRTTRVFENKEAHLSELVQQGLYAVAFRKVREGSPGSNLHRHFEVRTGCTGPCPSIEDVPVIQNMLLTLAWHKPNVLHEH